MPANAGDAGDTGLITGSSHWVKKIPWRRKWQATPVFLLGNHMDKGGWRAIVQGVANSQIQLSMHAHPKGQM